MAGQLTIDTLKASSGVLATQNGMTGIAKAWVNFDGFTGSTATVRTSFNVSSVTRNSTGDYTINFTTAMPNANYAYALSNRHQAAQSRGIVVGSSNTTPTTTSFRIENYDGVTTLKDVDYICVTILSS